MVKVVKHITKNHNFNIAIIVKAAKHPLMFTLPGRNEEIVALYTLAHKTCSFSSSRAQQTALITKNQKIYLIKINNFN